MVKALALIVAILSTPHGATGFKPGLSPARNIFTFRQSSPDSIPGSPGGSRMADMMRRTEEKKEFIQSNGYEPPPSNPNLGNEQEVRRQASFKEAAEAGFDPEDEESMKMWRRHLAAKARERMANNRAFAPVDVEPRKAEGVDVSAPVDVIAQEEEVAAAAPKREMEEYIPFDEGVSDGGGGMGGGQDAEKQKRLAMMRGEGGDDDDEFTSTAQWSNDDYIDSLKRKPEELNRKEWERPKRRLWHNSDWDPQMFNNGEEDAEAAAKAYAAATNGGGGDSEEEEEDGDFKPRIMDTLNAWTPPEQKVTSYAQQLVAARELKQQQQQQQQTTVPPAATAAAPVAPAAAAVAPAAVATAAPAPVAAAPASAQEQQATSYAQQLVAARELKKQQQQLEASSGGEATASAAPAKYWRPPSDPKKLAASVKAEAMATAAKDAAEAEAVAKRMAARQAALADVPATQPAAAAPAPAPVPIVAAAPPTPPPPPMASASPPATAVAVAPAPPAAAFAFSAASSANPLAPTELLGGSSFLASAVEASGGDLGTLRERLLGALTLVDQMMAFQGSMGGGAPAPAPAPVAAPAAPPPPMQAQVQAQPQAQAQVQAQQALERIEAASMSEAAAAAQAAAAATQACQVAQAAAAQAAEAAEAEALKHEQASKEAEVAAGMSAASPLDAAAADKVRAAMAVLIKHRGGGPFGEGRVPRNEVEDLENKLETVLDVLKQTDFGGADPITGEACVDRELVATKDAVMKKEVAASFVANMGKSQAADGYMAQLQAARVAKASAAKEGGA